MGRLGRPQEIADLCVYLASDEVRLLAPQGCQRAARAFSTLLGLPARR